MSIPRLELQGAVLAARVDLAVRRELNFEFEQIVFWADSMIVLDYSHNENRRFQTYVANSWRDLGPHFTTTVETLSWQTEPR